MRPSRWFEGPPLTGTTETETAEQPTAGRDTDFAANPADSVGAVTDHCCPKQVRSQEDYGDAERGRIALLSQEGSTIETAVEIVRGVVPESHSLRMQSETFRFGTTPRVIAKTR